MTDYKTPGVYIEEISKLPASVAPVATAVPAFVGYTSKKEREGETLDPNTPVRITSLLEFEQIFGGPFSEVFDVTIEDPSVGETNPTIDVQPNAPGLSPYLMYYQIQMYFANGGGPCHVVSVGTYNETDPTKDNDIKETELSDGIDACEEVDEITLLTVPEAILLDDNGRENINNAMLTQCNKLQDRFAILDAFTDSTETVIDDGINFRGDVGNDNLKYGAAYYPSLKSTIPYFYEDADVSISDNRGGAGAGFFDGQNLENLIDDSMTPTAATASIEVDGNAASEGDVIIINGHSFTVISSGTRAAKADQLRSDISGVTELTDILNVSIDSSNDKKINLEAKTEGSFGNTITINYPDTPGLVIEQFSGGNDSTDSLLYNLIKDKIEEVKTLELYPSASMAGVYARIDRERGVWKAPANVSLRLVQEPSKLVTDGEQGPLNVDPDTGKSINVIRKFQQKGIIVWGARTLAGNDNEWRYIPVRRLFIFIEESIQKATEPVIFEPNDANTWLKTKSIIENFLTGLWRDGALAGATAEEAFFVKVGLGQTMSSNDILEGRMIIEVGIAAVRPAEFIILKFSHKLQEA